MTMEGLRERRPDVLDELLARFGREIQTVAYVIIRDASDAEEALAETLLTALECGHQLRDETALRAWLLRIAANQALGMRRRSVRLVVARNRLAWRSGDPDSCPAVTAWALSLACSHGSVAGQR